MDAKTLREKIEAGFLKGSEIDQSHKDNAYAFADAEHMDESYLLEDEERYLQVDDDE